MSILEENELFSNKIQNPRPYQICKCCVMDTTDEDIAFDLNGVCMRCNEYKERIEPEWITVKGMRKSCRNCLGRLKSQEKVRSTIVFLVYSEG